MILYLRNKDTGQWESVPALVGPPGDTPYIGANGHWWIGETDTGVPARGEGSGDMLVETYDKDGSVAAAGGIAAYVEEHGGGAGGDLDGYAKETWVAENYQPKGSYLTEVPEGYAKKAEVPTHLHQLSGDSTHRTVTDEEKRTWNSKSDFSGNYSDLSGKPTIPTVDMKKADYDADGKVKAAGGIAAYVAANAGGSGGSVVTGEPTIGFEGSVSEIANRGVTYYKIGNVYFIKGAVGVSMSGTLVYINLRNLPFTKAMPLIGIVSECYTSTGGDQEHTYSMRWYNDYVRLEIRTERTISGMLEIAFSAVGYTES